jgi:hypothetical protein
MPNKFKITCVRCGHTWFVDLQELDRPDQTVYRGAGVLKEYRVRCPNDGTWNHLTIEVEEDGNEGTPG